MRAMLLTLAVALAGCSAAPPAGAGANEAFARELAGRTAGPAQSCVSTIANQGLRAVDTRTVAYEAGRTLWVNRLQSNCSALNPHNALIVEASAGQYCRGDRVRGLEPVLSVPGPPCILQDWIPYRRR